MTVKISLIATARRAGVEFDRFLGCIARQEPGLYSAEVIVVPVGRDDLAPELEALTAAAGAPVVILPTSSPSVPFARRAGLALARGDWVTFPRSRDAMDPGYLRAVAPGYRRG